MKTKTWILVANAAKAKIFKTENLRSTPIELIRELTHPESKKKVSELISDKIGRYKTDSKAHGAYIKSDPKEIEALHFATQLVHELKDGENKNNYQHLIVVATSHFYGLINKQLHPNRSIQVTHVLKDYTNYTASELQLALKEHLFG